MPMKTLLATVATLTMGTAAMADTDIRFTLGWKTQGSDAPFLMALDQNSSTALLPTP